MGIDRLFFLSSTSTWSARIIPKLDHPFARLAPTLLLGNHIALLAKACINFDEDRWKVFRRFEVTPCIGLIKNTQLKESKLGVFITFQELGFEWTSRLVHYMLGFQLDIKEKYELWSLVGPEPVRFSLLEFENLTGLNFKYIEDLERPQCIFTKELTSFWGMLGEIIAALGRCEGWSRDDCKRFAYLAIFTGYIEGRKYSTPTRVSLARLVMELERFENYPWGRVAFKLCPILAYKGGKGRRRFKEAILDQTRVINFVEKDIAEMFPKLEFDVEDTPADNIIKLIKNVVKEDSARPRKKARKEAPAEAPAESSEEVHTVARSEVTATVGGLTKEDIKTMFKDVVDAMREGFGTCLKEIKYLSERVEAVEKKVGITTKRKGTGTSSQNRGTGTSSQNTTSPPKNTLEPGKDDARYKDKRDAALALCREKSDRTRRLAASQQSPYTANRTAKVIIPNKKLFPGYNPFVPIDKKKLMELADWLKTYLHYRAALDKKPRTSRTWWYHILRTSLEWLENCKTVSRLVSHLRRRLTRRLIVVYVDGLPDDLIRLPISRLVNRLRRRLTRRLNSSTNYLRLTNISSVVWFVFFVNDLPISRLQWSFNFKDFKDSEPDQNGLGRRLPGGAWNYYAGTIPSFCQSNKVWGTDIDDIYAPVNYNDNHWIAMWISIPKRHIFVFDSICSSISPEELDVVMEPFLYMVPYLLVECASSDEQRAQYSLEPFTFERPDNIPPARRP
ncbi:hypothetical protein BRARA_E01848 [Brassica rapa]|uniref:Ubiquitin-like protease family profile domain-containing protein n=1 Tax=Brassica campestris TaxID=3711 RepID=A0A397ZK61_BRACM|nr:hypothetical protein BRARA_E01848 [Brassica rapa]